MNAAKKPKLAIVGRPNVGKSTLFNRLLGRRRALVHDEPGVTRDRLEEDAEWWVDGSRFQVTLVDTGGLGGDRFADEISHQVSIAVEEADVVIVLFDGPAGLASYDREVLRRIQQSGLAASKPLIGVVNKIDAESHEEHIADFYSTGLDPIVTISAEHGRGIDDLKAAVAQSLSFEGSEEEAPADVPETRGLPKIAIVGRPNVGKSTLINALLGEERMITSPVAGTTVDAVDSVVELGGRKFLFIDTAGIRRKSKTEQGVEVLSVVLARKALERCDVAILLLDGETGITDQDEKIGGIIEEIGCSVVLALNKWDTQKRNPKFSREKAAEIVRKEMAYLKYAPLLFLSAKRREGFENLGDLLEEILAQRRVKVGTHEFSEWVREEAPIHNPMNAKFYLCHQSGRNPPTFVCHVNDPERVHFSLKRHLVNALREKWGFMGSPVRLLFIEGKNRRSLPKKRPPKRSSNAASASAGKS